MFARIQLASLPSVVVLASLFACIQLSAQSPHWIWNGRQREAGQLAHLRTTFTLEKGIRRATLRAAADFNDATLRLNGKQVGEAENYGPNVELDVTDFIRKGDNTLEVNCTSTAGPAAIAIELRVELDDETVCSIVSDTSWPNSVSFGKVASEMWGSPRDIAINELDNYEQWKQASSAEAGSDPGKFFVAAGFEIELIRSAGKDEGSWVSMAFDPQGRLTIAREDRGLLRLGFSENRRSIAKVESIDDTLLECRGLLYAHEALYANANNSKGLYRLRDTTGDDQFDEIKLLHQSPGSVGHGRNDLALGPDGMIYSMHGDAVDVPTDMLDRTSPFRENRRGQKVREGHLIRMDRDGNGKEVVAAGLRNPYGIDFNTDGELFTYDADAEFDMGSPWYRPTRVAHLVSGADFGWRGVTGNWPPYFPDHPDNGLPVLDIGKGSPTAVMFGTKSSFPSPYREALFILDWAYGRIVAVHMTPRGASYRCQAETFVKGRPLNVTDLDFGPDHAMYVVTGGRKTQSALYRIRYVGPPVGPASMTAQQIARREHGAKARDLRQKLESLHGRQDPATVETAWPHLDEADPWIRHAARVAIETQPLDSWRDRALKEHRTNASLAALMALARSGDEATKQRIASQLLETPLAALSTSQKLVALHTYSMVDDAFEEATKQHVQRQLSALYPDDSYLVNQRLSMLLMKLESPDAIEKTLGLLAAATDQRQRMHYMLALRKANIGWQPRQRTAYFAALKQMDRFQGGEGMPGFIRRIRDEALATVSEEQRPPFAALLESDAVIDDPTESRPFVRKWKLEDLSASLPSADKGRDLQRGEQMFRAAACSRCHRFGTIGFSLGPDLTSVANRFSRRDIVESILNPSNVVAEQYRQSRIVTAGGKIIVGRIVPGNDYRSPKLLISTDARKPNDLSEIAKSEIESHTLSPISPMPDGLLDTLSRDEILDLLAFLQSGRK